MKPSIWIMLAGGMAVALLTACENPVASGGDGDLNYTSPNIGTLIYVPSGSYQRDADAENVTVISRAFRMSRYEISRAQFAAVMGDDPSDPGISSSTAHPVQRVNWYHAIAFANKLSLNEGLTPVYSVTGVDFGTLAFGDIPTGSNADWNGATANWDANGYRLPTEAEWMWAAMGAPADGRDGGVSITGYQKAFSGSTGSNDVNDFAVYFLNSGPGDAAENPRTARAVGSKQPNELGLYDMAGNVNEWVWEWAELDGGALVPLSGELTDPRGPASGTFRFTRGGSYNAAAHLLEVAERELYDDPHQQRTTVGLRLVRL